MGNDFDINGDNFVQFLVAAHAVNNAEAIIMALLEENENILNDDNRLTSGTMHAILQLHSILTRTHSILFNFLDEGGLPMLPPLPTSSPFSGFDDVAATIIRYILEIPHLVQRSPKKLILVTAKRS